MRKKLAICKRLLAGLLVLTLVLSDFSGASFASYAAEAVEENTGVSDGDAPVVEEPVVEKPGVSEGDAPVVEEPIVKEPAVSEGDAVPVPEGAGDESGEVEIKGEGDEPYTGSLTESDGNVFLDIDPMAVGKTSFSEEELLAILAAHTAGSCDVVSIYNGYSADRVISAEVYNAAVALLGNNGGNAIPQVQFCFYNEENNARLSLNVCEPVANWTEDFTFVAEVNFTSDNKVQIKPGTYAFDKGSVNLSYLAFAGSEEYTKLAESLGTAQKKYEIGNGGACDYMYSEYSADLFVNVPDGLAGDTFYEVKEYVYKGDKYSYSYDGETTRYSLSINTFMAGVDKTDDEIIIDALAAWEGETFDSIYIDRSHGDKNIIKKEVLNKAISLLNKENNDTAVGITYVKPGNGMGESWRKTITFISPDDAKADINADNLNVTVSADGMKVQNNAYYKDINALVDISYAIGLKTEEGKAWQAALDEENASLVFVQDGKSVDSDPMGYTDISIVMNLDRDDSHVNLNIWDVNRFALKKAYTAAKFTYMSEASLYVGVETAIPLSRESDEGTSVSWKSSDEAIVMVVDGKACAQTAGSARLTATYVSGGQTYVEVFQVYCSKKLNKIAFDRAEITMEISEQDGMYPVDYLGFVCYPAGVSVAFSEFIVEVSEEGVVEVSTDDGISIQAVAPGTVTITATHRNNPEIKAECVVTVQNKLEPEIPDNVYVHTDFCTTLKEAKGLESADENGSWAWKYPETSLADYKGANGASFPAVYTAKDGRTTEAMVYVQMFYITRLDVWASGFFNQSAITLNAGERMLFISGAWQNNDADKLYDFTDYYEVKWSVSGGGTLSKPEAEELPDITYAAEADFYQAYTAGNKKGKDTITVSVINKKTNKIVLKNSMVVNVVTDDVVDWDEVYIFANEEIIEVTMPQRYNFGVTAKSQSKIVTPGKVVRTLNPSDETVVYEFPLNFKECGHAYITLTFGDAVKSTRQVEVSKIDTGIKVNTKKLTINAATTDAAAIFSVSSFYGINSEETRVVGENADKFDVYRINESDDETWVKLALKDRSLKGKVKVEVEFPMLDEFGEPTDIVNTQTFDVNVVNTAPKVKITQNAKVNLFYTDVEGAGMFTIVSAEGAEVSNITLGDYVDKNPSKNAECDFEIIDNPSSGVIVVALKEGATGKKNKGTLSYMVDGYLEVTTTLTIQTEKKKPTVVCSAKGASFYMTQGAMSARFEFSDKNIGEKIYADDVQWVVSSKDIRDISGSGTDVALKKNSFIVTKEYGDVCVKLNPDTFGGAAAEILKLQIKEDNWAEPIAVSFKLDVQAKPPVLKLGSSKVTLNKNAAVYKGQVIQVPMNYKDSLDIIRGDVIIVGLDEDSRKVLNNNLILSYWNSDKVIDIRFNDNDLAAKNYNFEIRVQSHDGYQTKTKLVVSVIDKKADVKITKKGNIDVLLRDSTYLTFTGKAVNAVGTPCDGYLTGKDADRFDTYFMDGELRVFAKAGETYSTKVSYEVVPVFKFDTNVSPEYTIEGKAQTFKVKQSKPKVTCSADPLNEIQTHGIGEIALTFQSKIKEEEVVIERVELMNYQNDFIFREYDYVSPASCRYILEYNDYSYECEIYKPGTYTLKFKIVYRDKAGNMKDDTINYKVVIK